MFETPQPLSTRLIVEVVVPKEKKLHSDILEIPDDAGSNYNTRLEAGMDVGEIVAFGPECNTQAILRKADVPDLNIGDVVLFLTNAGKGFRNEDKTRFFRIMDERDILAIVGKTIEEKDNG